MFCAFSLSAITTYSQLKLNQDTRKLGVSVGWGNQDIFPYQNENYNFEHSHIKLTFNQGFYTSKLIDLEFQIEPTYYRVQHQLLNKFFIQPQDFEDFEALRAKYTQKRSFNSYAVNFAILARYKLTAFYSFYALASIGPMYSDAGTERLKHGFTFTDIFGIGQTLHFDTFQFDVRLYLKHDSNANLRTPNHGHNAVVFETGVLVNL